MSEINSPTSGCSTDNKLIWVRSAIFSFALAVSCVLSSHVLADGTTSTVEWKTTIGTLPLGDISLEDSIKLWTTIILWIASNSSGWGVNLQAPITYENDLFKGLGEWLFSQNPHEREFFWGLVLEYME